MTVDSIDTEVKIRQVVTVGFKKKVPTDAGIRRITHSESLATVGQNSEVLRNDGGAG